MRNKVRFVSVLPAALEYRLEEYKKAAEQGIEFVCLIGDDTNAIGNSIKLFESEFSVKRCKVLKFGKIRYQSETVRCFLAGDYDYFFIQAHFWYLDFWIIAILNLIFRRNLMVHGQGLYRYPKPGWMRSILYRFVIFSSSKYMFYNRKCLDDFVDKMGNISMKKLVFTNNFVRFKTPRKVKPSQGRTDILVIGRLRPGNEVEKFLDTFVQWNDLRTVHIIGDGPALDALKFKYSAYQNVVFYGAIIDENEIAKIASRCGYGVYPGNAGLSVIHYVYLGLIPLFHSNFHKHSGPEFWLLEQVFRYVCFKEGDYVDGLNRIKTLETSKQVDQIQEHLTRIYDQVEKSSFGNRLASLLW